MIIINLGGFLYAAIMITIIVLLLPLTQKGISENIFNLICACISLPVAVILEIFRLKPRIFFVPGWILALIFIGVQAWINWGVYSIIIDAALIFGGYKFLEYSGKKNADKRWLEALKIISELEGKSHTEKEKRTLLLKAFVTNSILLGRHDVIKHNITVLTLVKNEFIELFTKEKIELIDSFLSELEDMLTQEKPKVNDFELPDKIQEVLSSSLA